MRLTVTGGGTAGHVYPALSVIERLTGDPRWGTRPGDVLWVGSPAGMEGALVRREGIRFEAVSTGALRGKSPVALVKGLQAIRRGISEARALLREWHPDAILATGGYVSAPLIMASRGLCPVLIYLPDVQPGMAIRYLGRRAQRIAVSFDEVRRFFPADKVFVSGYPVRRGLIEADKQASRRALGLLDADEGARMLLVLGGSRGAHSINMAVKALLTELLELAHVYHITGVDDYPALQALADGLPEARAARYHPMAYAYEEMTDLLAAADLVVARSGAATLGEFPAVGAPAVLVPYPYAGQHQELNASYLVERSAARMVRDRDLGAELLPTVRSLLSDAATLERMSAASRAAAVPLAAERIAEALLQMAQQEEADQ